MILTTFWTLFGTPFGTPFSIPTQKWVESPLKYYGTDPDPSKRGPKNDPFLVILGSRPPSRWGRTPRGSRPPTRFGTPKMGHFWDPFLDPFFRPRPKNGSDPRLNITVPAQTPPKRGPKMGPFWGPPKTLYKGDIAKKPRF